MGFLSKILGNANIRYLKRITLILEKVNSLEQEFEAFPDIQLKEKTQELKKSLEKTNNLDNLLVQAFALVREASKRTLQQRHFDVQVLAGIALHQGKIIEMRTGEGKTLAATLPAYLNALNGKGVHIITVNDYLARRDTVWMGQIYDMLGLSVGCITHESAYLYDTEYQGQGILKQGEHSEENLDSKSQKNDKERDEQRDVLGGFKVEQSYLRPVQRKQAYLADITYGTNNEFGFDYLRDNMAHHISQQVQRKFSFAILDEIDSILIDEARTPLIISAPDTKASEMYRQFAKIVLRLSPDKDYEIDEERKSVSLTEQGIKNVENILGVGNIYTGEGIDHLHHLEQALRAQAINPNDNKALFAKDRDYVVKNGQVIIVDEFTGRLMPGRRWSGGLHQAIEAKENVDIKAESRTLATITFQNFFRLYKKLAGMTGTALTSAEEFDKVYGLDVIDIPTNKPMIRNDLSDKIYRTEKEKYKALVQEVKERHKKAQPVLIGTRSISKNEYLAQLLKTEGIVPQMLNAKHHEQEGEIIAQAGKLNAITVATNMAGRGVDIILGGYPPSKNKEELYEKWESEHKKVVELGGLHVIGTERHTARRIDDQLRGRSGRQGDPGSSQFFLSLEDELMRVFGGENIKNLMTKLNMPQGQAIEVKIVSRAVESAQAKIEGLHLDARKQLLDYDNVMTKHRNAFYKQRNLVLKSSFGELRKELISICAEYGISEKDFTEKEKEIGETFLPIVRALFLKTLDFAWMGHLEDMSWLRDSVRLRGYARLDPLVEYKTGGFKMFKEMMESTKQDIVKIVTNLKAQKQQKPKTPLIVFPQDGSRKYKKKVIGRNDPCPCGSGKKYKKCCWPKFG